MARNASGTYTLPNAPVVGATVISTTWANTTLADLEAEMTDSLNRSGKGAMLAPLLLTDGTVGLPGLAFGTEPSTGLYRPAANELGLSLAGVQRVRVTTGSAAPGSTFTSPQAAAGVQTDFLFNTTAVRTAGKLLDVQNAGSSVVAVDPSGGGQLFLRGPNLVFTSTDGNVITSVANGGLIFKGNKNAADAGTDMLVNTTATRTAGSLFVVQNNGASKFAVAFDSAIQLLGPNARVAATAANSSLVLRGNKDAADSGSDVVVSGTVARTAGVLLSVQNGGVDRAWFVHDGSLWLVGPNPTLQAASTPNTTLTLRGNKAAADGGTDVVVNTAAVRTAGNLFAVQNGGTTVLRYDTLFGLVVGAAGDKTVFTGSVRSDQTANQALTLIGNKAAADAGTDVVADTTAVRTAGSLFEVRNGGSSRLTVNTAGDLTANRDIITTSGWFYSNHATPTLTTTVANAPVRVIGNKNAADVSPDVILSSTATRTAGDIFIAQNNGTTKFSVDWAGNMALRSSASGADSRIEQAQTDAGFEIRGNRAAASAGADVAIDTGPTRTAGVLLALRNSGVEKASFAFDGELLVQGFPTGEHLGLKTADQSESAATITNATGLSFSVEASKTYVWEAVIVAQSAATTTGLVMDHTAPASPTTDISLAFGHTTAYTAFGLIQGGIGTGSGWTKTDFVNANANEVVMWRGVFVNGVNAGTFQLRFRTEVATSAVTLKKGSYIRWRRLD